MVFVVALLLTFENEASMSSTYRKKKSKMYNSDFNFMAAAKEFIGGLYELIYGSTEVENYFQNIVLRHIDRSTKPILILQK